MTSYPDVSLLHVSTAFREIKYKKQFFQTRKKSAFCLKLTYTLLGVRLNLGGEMFSEAYNLMSEKCPLPTENVLELIKLRGRSIWLRFLVVVVVFI